MLSIYHIAMWTLPLAAVLYCVRERSLTALKALPGPFVASITDGWRFWTVWHDAMPHKSLLLHREHGPLVRLGPRYVSASSPEAVHLIYRAGTGFQKSKIYGMLQPQLEGSDLHNLFSTQDKALHAKLKRHLGALYSQRGVLTAELHIDKTIDRFVQQLDVLATQANSGVDMSSWLQWWAFDTIGEINLSRDLGFMTEGKDVDQLCAASHASMRYFGLMGQILGVERIYSTITAFLPSKKGNPLFESVLDRVGERNTSPEQSEDKLDDFLALSRAKSDFTQRDVIAATYITLVTAHDVLAILLRAVMYYLAKNPSVMVKFRSEIATAEKDGKLSMPATYEELTQMTYLNAIILETLRIHPSTGLLFERTVPEGGIELHGRYIPGGTTIGVNAWVFNRDKTIFGQDSDEYRPERWIEGTADQLKEMHKWLLTFGVGARSCIGKNLAMMETVKLMVALYRRFDFQLSRPDWEWQFDGSWLTAQGKMEMNVKSLR